MNTPFNDKERLNDALSSQKQMTADYNSFANESATPEVVSKVMEILREEHDIQRDMWCEMNSRGWYPTEAADDNKLNGVKSKYSTMAN